MKKIIHYKLNQMKNKQLLLFFVLPVIAVFSCRQEKTFQPEKYLDIALGQVEAALEHLPDVKSLPRQIPHGETHWQCTDINGWTSGFFPGILWQLYAYTGDPAWEKEARRRTEPLEPVCRWEWKNHDLGFMVFNSYGLGYQLTGDPGYKEVILTTADSLTSLYNPNTGTILSWPWGKERKGWSHNTIIDNMMNLELLFRASKNGGQEEWYDIAVRHALTTMKNQIREDYSTWHVVVYDSLTGEVTGKYTHQGYSDESMWARGQAWGIYGFTMTYRETGMPEFLETARGLADVFIKRLPADHIPYWDFDVPGIPDEERDASAAAIAASALIDLAEYTGNDGYHQAALNMIKTLSSEKYQAKGINNAVLLHSVGSKPGNAEVDVPLIYADYYYIEALRKLLNK